MDQDAPNTPCRETLPNEGRIPANPQKAAGPLMEPPVSSPNTKALKSAAAAMPDPLLEVPAFLVISQGFLGNP